MPEPVPPPPPSPPTPPPSAPSAPTEPEGPGKLILKVVGTVAAGIGILGFVAFVGGAILWVRADQAGLPATEAVAIIPNSVLVTTGATVLVPAVLTVVAVIGLIYLIHLVSRLPREAKERDRREEAKKLHLEAEAIGRDAQASLQAALSARAIYASLEEAFEKAKLTSDASTLAKLREAVDAQRLEAERLDQAAQASASAAAAKKAKADTMLEASNVKLERTRAQFNLEMAVGAVILIGVPLIFNQAPFHVSCKASALLIGVLLVACAISLFVYRMTEQFVWFGLVIFMTIGTYLGLSTYINTSENTKLQPAAALRTGHEPLYGAFIADTASNLYVGTFEEGGQDPYLLVIPRTQIAELTIGPLLDFDEVRGQAIAQALDQCAQQVEAPAPDSDEGEKAPPAGSKNKEKAPEAKAEDACPLDQKKALEDALKAS